MIGVKNFSVGDKKYRIGKELKNGEWIYRIQHQIYFKGFVMYENEDDEFWVSLDHLLASSKFQNLFK